MAQYRARQRREWLKWYFEHERNAAATCRHFGISRATFYRWLKRYDPSTPTQPLRSRSRRPLTKRHPTWTAEQMIIVSDLASQNPHWGRQRLHMLLRERYDWRWSAATVGRMLHIIHTKCPVCKGRRGQHDVFIHAAQHQFRELGVDLVAVEEARRRHRAPMTDQELQVLAEKAAAVKEAIQIARSGGQE